MDESSDEVKILKQEMKNHLLQTVEELKTEGKSEEESIEIAISRFGESGQIQSELSKVFNIQKKFAKVLFKAAFIFFAIAMITALSYGLTIGFDAKTNTELDNDLRLNINDKLEANDVIPKQNISNLFDKYNNKLRYIAVLKIDSKEMSSNAAQSLTLLLQEIKNTGFVYPTDVSINKFNIGRISIKGNTTDKWQVICGIKEFNSIYPYLPIIQPIGIFCFAVYWVCFGLWGVINAYHANRFSIAWIILFFTLNILALLLFKFDEANRFKNSKLTHPM